MSSRMRGDSSLKRRCPFCPARVRVSYLETHIQKHVNDPEWCGGEQRFDIPEITGISFNEIGIPVVTIREADENDSIR